MIEIRADMPWRAGSKRYRGHRNHRTLYIDDGQGVDDRMIGVMDTPELAELVVRTRAALAELVRLHDGPRDTAYESAKGPAWAEARQIMTSLVQLPDDTRGG